MIGVIVDEVANNTNSYILFRELNKLSENYGCYLFCDEVKSLPIENKFAIMNQVEAMSHSGILFSTSILTTQVLVNNLTASKKFFYVHSLDWMHIKYFGFNQLKKVFCHDEIDLIAKSESHNDILSKLFKKPSHIIYDWDVQKITEVIENERVLQEN